MSKKIKVAVLGAGNMGTAVAQVIAKNGYQVNLWNYPGDPQPLLQIKKYQENKKYLPGVKLSANVQPELDLVKVLSAAKLVFFIVPSFCIADVVKQAANKLAAGAICVDMSKGIDEKSLGIIPEVIKKNLPAALHKYIATVSGPAIANDLARGGFTAMNVASASPLAIKLIKQVMEGKYLKLFATTDLIGLEITGSFKNVYAIAMGLCDGLGLPMNTKAALLTIALKEISWLVAKMGGQAATVYDLAGLGDLIGTGLCRQSRNRTFGEYLAKGCSLKDSLRQVGQVVEGISAARVLHALGRKYKVSTPFAEMVYKVTSGKLKPAQALNKFLVNITG